VTKTKQQRSKVISVLYLQGQKNSVLGKTGKIFNSYKNVV